MATATILIKDGRADDGAPTIEMEGHLEPATAIDDAPTGAVVIGSYLAANMEQIQAQALAWFNEQVRSAMPTQDEQIAVPGVGIVDGQGRLL